MTETVKLSQEDKAKHLRYCKAMAMVRKAYKIPIETMDGFTVLEIQKIESGNFRFNLGVQLLYALAIGIDFGEFVDKVSANIVILENKIAQP